MKLIIISGLILLSILSVKATETQVSQSLNLYNTYKLFLINFNIFSATLNAHGNVTTPTVPQYAIQYASPQNATLPALNPEMLFATSNARSQNARSNALIRDVKCLTAQNA